MLIRLYIKYYFFNLKLFEHTYLNFNLLNNAIKSELLIIGSVKNH